MDKPAIDFDKLKQIKNQDEAKDEQLQLPHPSLTDPYYRRRHLISIEDFDEG